MAPVKPAGCDRQDVLRSARAFMKEVQSVGAVLLPFRGSNQDATPVRVSGSGRLRNSTLVGIPVRPRGSGLGCLPIRSLQQGGTARGRRAVPSTSSAGSSRPPLTVAQARDALRTVVSTPFKSPRGARLSSLTPSRPSSSSSSGPRSSSSSTVSSPGSITTSVSSVEVSQQEFQLQDKFGSVRSSSMPFEAISIASSSVTALTLSKYKSMFLRFKQFTNLNLMIQNYYQETVIGYTRSILGKPSLLCDIFTTFNICCVPPQFNPCVELYPKQSSPMGGNQ